MLSRGAGLRFVSGSWTALAIDAAQGVLYRPVMGPLGYGGTRYMPLHFALHGLFIDLTGSPAGAGAILTVLSAIGLLSGVYTYLRALDTAPRWAAIGGILSLASIASVLAITTIRGDLLPAALNVWGLALLARQLNAEKIRVVVPALFFVLAFSAKETTLFGLAAGVTTLALYGHRKPAVRLAAFGATGFVVVAIIAIAASHGRIIESMRVCGSGGAGPADLLKAPLKFGLFACIDLGFLPFFVAAAFAVASTHRTLGRELQTQAFLWTFAATVGIFGSPGIDFNHLLDLHVAGVVLLISQFGRGKLPRLSRNLFAIAGAISSAAILTVCGIAWYAFPAPLQSDRLTAFRVAQGESGPILSEDPWVPIVGGERPYLLDPFNLRLACAQDARIREDLWSKLEQQYFSGVVLTPIEDRSSNEFVLDGKWLGITHYGGIHFPAGFIKQLYRYYTPAAHIHCYLVLKPKRKMD